MALPSGLAAQAGFAIESTYGTFATPTVFTPMISETLEAVVDRMESQGIIAGKNVLMSGQWVPGAVNVAGDFQTELYDRAIGKHFKAMFGGVATTGSGPYTHTFTPGTLPSVTAQFGRPANDGTVYPAAYTGCKVRSWELGLKAGEIATLGLTYAGQNELIGSRAVTDGVLNSTVTVTSATAVFTDADRGKVIAGTGVTAGTTIASVESATSITLSATATATATGVTLTIGSPLASASYASGQLPIHFRSGALSLGGVNAYASEVTLKGDNGLTDRRPILGSDLSREFLPADLRMYAADVVAEFDGLTSYNAYRSGAEIAVSLPLTVGSYSATITGNARIDKATTTVAGKGILSKSLSLKFVASGSTDSTAITAVLVNGDSTP